MKKPELFITLFGGTSAPRCQARSKRSGEQCRKAAMCSKRFCRKHGWASTGPRTPEGRQKFAEAKTIHGRETRNIRLKHADKLREARELEQIMIQAGVVR